MVTGRLAISYIPLDRGATQRNPAQPVYEVALKALGRLEGPHTSADEGLLRKIIPQLELTDQLRLSLEIKERLEDKNWWVRCKAIQLLEYIIRYLEPTDRLGFALEIVKRLDDENQAVYDNAIVSLGKVIIPRLGPGDQLGLRLAIKEKHKDGRPHSDAAWFLGQISPPLTAEDRERLFPQLGLKVIFFKDSGEAFSEIPGFLEFNVDTPSRDAPLSIDDVPYSQTHLPLTHFLASQGVAEGDINLGRSTVYRLAHGAQLLVLKYAREGQNGGDLVREVQWLGALEAAGIIPTLRSPLPDPVRNERGQLELLTFENDRSAITFKAPSNYYRYLDDPALSDAEFLDGLMNGIHDIWRLARFGVFHTAPIAAFHTVGPNIMTRGQTQDQGRYVISPDLVFGFRSLYNGFGAGRLHDWPQAIRHGNIGATGMRDLEELATLREIMGGDRWMPELRKLKGRFNAGALYEAMLLGNSLLAATLYIGNRLTQQVRNYSEAIPFWQNDAWLQAYANQLLDLFATGYAARRGMPIGESRTTLQPRANWLRLARQLAFFMTNAHVPYVRPGAAPTDFPHEIYGKGVEVQGMGPYRAGTFHPELGFIEPDGDSPTLSLGPVNGPNPIYEFEKAWAATLF